MKTYLLLCIFIATPVLAQSDTEVEKRYSKGYVNCLQHEPTPVSRYCISKEYDRHDDILNATYKGVMAKLSPKRKSKLRQSQRQWIITRDAIARDTEKDWNGGTGAPGAYGEAMLQETVRRTIWLERYR